MPDPQPAAPPRLILASASPRRQLLLRQAGYAFTVAPSDVDESDVPAGLSPGGLAEHLALRKAHAVAAAYPDDVVLGADTIVALGDDVFGKPCDAEDARRMLTRLSGTTQAVITGVAIVRSVAGKAWSRQVRSAVEMRRLTPEEIADYVKGGRWEGKAGGYGIQDDDPFVTRMTGSLTNIVGLPMEAVTEMLSQAGVEPGEKRAPN